MRVTEQQMREAAEFARRERHAEIARGGAQLDQPAAITERELRALLNEITRLQMECNRRQDMLDAAERTAEEFAAKIDAMKRAKQ